jgi:hypothetical protein
MPVKSPQVMLLNKTWVVMSSAARAYRKQYAEYASSPYLIYDISYKKVAITTTSPVYITQPSLHPLFRTDKTR